MTVKCYLSASNNYQQSEGSQTAVTQTTVTSVSSLPLAVSETWQPVQQRILIPLRRFILVEAGLLGGNSL